jgi:hypothetical protein
MTFGVPRATSHRFCAIPGLFAGGPGAERGRILFTAEKAFAAKRKAFNRKGRKEFSLPSRRQFFAILRLKAFKFRR